MATSIFILQNFKKQQQVFLKNLEILRVKEDPDAIHDLRVVVKRLRSYLKLLAILSRQNDYKTGFEKTEYLFSVLGKLRDIEIGQSLLDAFEKESKIIYKALKVHLETAKQQVLAWVKTAVKNYDEKELTGLTQQIEEELKEKNPDELLKKVVAIINKELKNATRRAVHLKQQAHRVRKLLKDIFYWASLGPKNLLLDAEKVKKCKKIMEHLGNWQDHEMLHRKVKHFRKDFVPDAKEEYKLLKELERQIKDKMETILGDADKNIRNFLT